MKGVSDELKGWMVEIERWVEKIERSNTLGRDTPNMVHPEKKRPETHQRFGFPPSSEALACRP
jgi:hypothetical protein